MSSMLEQLWPIFIAEVGEKLDALETMITKATAQPGSMNNSHAVDALFREFHTLKSNLSMVDFKEPMEIANACEDILHGLRKSKTAPNRDILNALLESVDWIKKQVAEATPGQYPRIANEALHKKLAPFRRYDEQAPAEPPTPEPQTHTVNQESQVTKHKEALEIDTLRINSNSLDELVTQITQLILTEHRIDGIATKKNLAGAINTVHQTLQNENTNNSNIFFTKVEHLINTFSEYQKSLSQIDASIRTISDNIQENMLSLRAIPLSIIFTRLPRIVRQKATAYNKQVQLLTDGGDIAIDKSMIDVISEPIIHLLHNAVVHGIETTEERKANKKSKTGKIHISTTREGDFIQLDIQDDGRGIDYRTVRDKALSKGLINTAEQNSTKQAQPDFWLNFLFSHGFNSDIPNRTTGLDVVRDHLLRIGGSIHLQSTVGVGTRFTVRMPITVAIQNTLIVQASQQNFAIPLRQVVEITEATPEQLAIENGVKTLQLRGNALPIYTLSTLLQLNNEQSLSNKKMLCVILQHDEQCIALLVDNVQGKQDLFLRNIHQDLRTIPGISGVSLLGNGNVIIILDCEGLFRLTGRYVEPAHALH